MANPNKIIIFMSGLNSVFVWLINLAVLAVIICFSSFIANHLYKNNPKDFEGMSDFEIMKTTQWITAGIALFITFLLIVLVNSL